MKHFALSSMIFVIAACESKPQAPKVEGGNVIAQVGSELILDHEFLKIIEEIEKKTPQVPSTHTQKKELLEEWINIQLLYQEALRKGFDESFRFRSKLAEAYIENLAENARAKVDESSLRAHYDRNKASYDQIAARHILFKTSPEMSEKEKIEKYKKLEEIRKQAIQSPEKFSELARAHSEDGSNRQGGDLGYFNYSMMVPSFAKAAFQLKKVNDISPIISSPFGYHIIQLRDDRRGFDHHAQQIQDLLVRQYQVDLLKKEISRLRDSVKISVFEEELLKLSPLPDIIKKDPEEVIPEDAFQTEEK